jgi:anti-sigma factor RsiW
MTHGGTHKHSPECKEVFALLSKYLDHELPEADCAEIEHHMADCAPCVKFLESLRRTVELCRGCPPAAEPNPIDPNVKRQLFETWQKFVASRR